jgi:hypothetical protein
MNMPSATRGTLFEKTVPLNPRQKLLINYQKRLVSVRVFVALLNYTVFDARYVLKTTRDKKLGQGVGCPAIENPTAWAAY